MRPTRRYVPGYPGCEHDTFTLKNIMLGFSTFSKLRPQPQTALRRGETGTRYLETMATPFVIPPAPAPVAASSAAPGAVAAAPAWTASEILKIRLEGPTRQLPSAYVGFVDIRPDSTSLADVRALIARDVDGAPRHGRYHFLFADGVPISRRQEASQLAMQLLPAVTIRASDSGLYGSNARPAQGAAEKVVFQFQDDQHTSWMPAGYTFAQLVADAARYWKLRPDDVILEDADGCAWPESVQVSSLVSLPLPDGKPFLLHLALKDGAVVLRERFSSAESAGSGSGGGHDGHDTTSSARGSGLSSEGGRTGAERAAEAQSAGSAPNLENRSPPTPSHAVDSSHQKRGHAPSAVHDPQSAQPDGASSPPLSGSDVDSELWNIFSYYCVHGDAKEVQHLRRHHWLQLMRDIGLLGPQLGNSTSCALFRVIYTAETRGSVGSSGKMNYAEFLDALMNVAVRACDPRQSRASVTSAASISPRAADTVDPATLDASFVDLLATYILPRAKRWNTHTWHQHTALLRSADVVHVVQPFLKPLYDIFRFYAPDPHSQADGTASVLHLYLDYTGFKKVRLESALWLATICRVCSVHVGPPSSRLSLLESRGFFYPLFLVGWFPVFF